MNDILKDTEELKELIVNSKEYQEYLRINKVLDNNKEINEIVSRIKKEQKIAVNNIAKNKNSDLNESELNELFDQLYSYDEYQEYLKISKDLNNLITKIQKRFEKEFNDILN